MEDPSNPLSALPSAITLCSFSVGIGDYDRGLKDLDLLKMGFRGWLILDRFFSSDAIPSESFRCNHK